MATSRSWAGWVAFAAVMMIFVGAMNIFEGIVALVQDDRVAVAADNFVVVDLTSWAWTLLISGALLILTSVGLLLGQSWARFLAIIIVMLHAIMQVASIGAYPIWALMMIALDTIVLFALTARWAGTREELAYDSDAFGTNQYESRSRQETYQPPRIA
ncbi:hypothetical protein K1W54_03010 [Micromonospora sp. CPCC 205371]|nr:hypothetical protein [Micromonospora sp. CPCC 205371]